MGAAGEELCCGHKTQKQKKQRGNITYKLKLTGGDMKAVQGDSGHAGLKMREIIQMLRELLML